MDEYVQHTYFDWRYGYRYIKVLDYRNHVIEMKDRDGNIVNAEVHRDDPIIRWIIKR